MTILDTRQIRKTELDGMTVKVSLNEAQERIFVDFVSEDGKLKLQKSFQNNFLGLKDAEKFEASMKSIKELKGYFKIK